MVKYMRGKKTEDVSKKSEELMINRMMVVFVGIFLLAGGLIFISRFNDKQIYFNIMPVLKWVVLGLLALSFVYFVFLRVKKIDEGKFIVRSHFLIIAFAVLYAGFALYSRMKISIAQLILIFALFAVLYFVCTIFANKAKIKPRK